MAISNNDDLLKRWEELRGLLDYHGVTEFIKDITAQIYVACHTLDESVKEASGQDDSLFDGAQSILRSVGDQLDDLRNGRLPCDALYVGKE